MGDHDNSKLDHENHLLLDQPLLRLPFELLRKNFRSAHFEVEKEGTYIKNTLKETATSAVNGRAGQADVLRSLDAMLARVRGVKRKLGAFAAEEERLQRHEEARARHLAELYAMHGVDDVKYEVWSRTRLDRLLVDYLLRRGYGASARALAQERGIELLVDVETFEQMSRIRKSLLAGSVTEALAWCTAGDTKKELRKINVRIVLYYITVNVYPLAGMTCSNPPFPFSQSNLEFMLRYQQYIELVRNRSSSRGSSGNNKSNNKPNEALAHARKYLLPYKDSYPREVQQACGLLAIPPGAAPSIPAYADLYSASRWSTLADNFTKTHNELLALPSVPLLHVALSSGLSALKTPACHPQQQQHHHDHTAHHSQNYISNNNSTATTTTTTASSSESPEPSGDSQQTQQQQDHPHHHDHSYQHHQQNSSAAPPSHATSLSLATSVCPICSTELNELARGVPYAFHSKSHVEHDLLLLPNGRAYGQARLEEYARKAGLLDGQVKDLRTGEVFGVERLKKVYIT
ncbi:GID complex subunit containing RING finger motif [Diatrype stigma]|uniref:GID complex subunit containing RING finger motif n=1 Tax=Diatrype stigma TaxID=117547 RepID=A0AAN9UDA0_9PEZI